MKQATILTAALTVSVAVAAPARAAPSDVELVGTVELERTVVENGVSRTVRAEPKVVLPGDRLVFTTRYRNQGAAPAQNFVVSNAVPAGVVVMDASAAELEVSVDAGKAWGRLATLSVPDGQGGHRPAQPGDITHVRWKVAVIAAGTGGAVQYRAVVR